MNELFISVLNMSLTASYVIAAIMLVRLFLKKAPKVISYALWAVAGFRLAFPFSFESAFSLIPFKTEPASNIISNYVGEPIEHIVSSPGWATPAEVGSISNTMISTPVDAPMYFWLHLASDVWLIGIVGMLIYSVLSIVLLKRRLRAALLSEGNIYEAENLKTPFVLGFIRPKIYIPSGLSAEEKNYIILHEQTHIKRFDHVIKLASFLILCVHWFNPFVWIAFLLMSADIEMSCDERVLKEMGGEIKQSYSMSLLSLATGRHLINGSPLAFGEGNIKGRIKNVLSFKKPVLWIIATAIFAVIAIGIGLLSNPIFSAPSMEWAKSLTLNDIVSIELVVMPSNEGERYRKCEHEELSEIVNLIRQSHGKFVKNPELVAGGGQTFYITTKDEFVHKFSNNGNRYLVINGDNFEAGYDWLNSWNFTGNMAIPEGFWERVHNTSAEGSISSGTGKALTLDNVRALARKGETLSFEDFNGFFGGDASSNFDYHIMVYGVEDGYRLIVRTDSKQIDSTNLESIWESGGSGIDIRYKDVDEFIKSHPSSEALTQDEAKAVAAEFYPSAISIQEVNQEAITMAENTYSCFVFEVDLPDRETERIAIAKKKGIIFTYTDGKWWYKNQAS